MLNLGHKKLEAWKYAMKLAKEIYSTTEGFPRSEGYGLTPQLRRAAVSVPSNIAEGASRSSSNDRRRFYEIARSSLVELDTQLEISRDLGYVGECHVPVLEVQLNSTFALLSKLIDRT
jgi:four helix bundle protein